MGTRTEKVNFFFDGTLFSLRDRTKLKRFVEFIFKQEKVALGSLNYVFCSDKKLLEINREYLKHDYLTDIITFDLSEDRFVIAEVYISGERVRKNAAEHGVTFKVELHRVIFHGALHLCGYNDKTSLDSQTMREKEDYYLEKYLG